MELEEVFSSKPRMKILKLIHQMQQLNVSKIASQINMNYSATAEHLRLLEAEGILEVRVYGRVHLYRFGESAKAKAVAALIEAWE
ncbi:MAG: winged helix-turn-helix domain-containing protein [Candidatus Bathyarchaeota archaeon]|nr:winged helix-turn-helix domain-containing protein [Candidatus Bathyarchaeota archaeon]